MVALINFRYLTGFGKIDKYIVNEVVNSIEIDDLGADLKHTMKHLSEHFSIDDIMNNDVYLNEVKIQLGNLVNYEIGVYNSSIEYNSYLWFDELCTVAIKNNKAMPLEDETEYFSFSDVKKTVSKAINNIALKNKSFDIYNYKDIIFVVYIDIIDKLSPPVYLYFPEE